MRPIACALASILAAGAGLAAAARQATPPAGQVVARVNGVAITGDALTIALSALMPMTSIHGGVSPEKQAELRAKALKGLIDDELRYQEAIRLNLRVSSKEVDEGLARAKQRYKTPEAFEAARRQAGVSLERVRHSIQRALLIQKIHAQVVGARCAVSEAEARDFYGDNPKRFVMPEQLHVYVITIGVDPSGSKQDWENGRARAEQLAKEIHGGASFEELAKKHSTDPSRDKGGDFGVHHRGQLIDEFEAALKTMRPGEVSPVVQTIYGYHLLRLAAIHPPKTRTFDEVKTQLVADLSDQRCASLAEEWLGELLSRATIEISEPNSELAPAADLQVK